MAYGLCPLHKDRNLPKLLHRRAVPCFEFCYQDLNLLGFKICDLRFLVWGFVTTLNC